MLVFRNIHIYNKTQHKLVIEKIPTKEDKVILNITLPEEDIDKEIYELNNDDCLIVDSTSDII